MSEKISDKFNRMKIGTKILIICLILVIVPTLVLGIVSYVTASNAINNQLDMTLNTQVTDFRGMTSNSYDLSKSKLNGDLNLLRNRFAVSGSPQIVDGKIAYGGQIINDNFGVVDSIEKDMDVKATVFQKIGDKAIRVSTNVIGADGKRAIGTAVSDAVYNAVVVNGQTYYGSAVVVGKPFFAAYEPIKNAKGEIIGILFVGVPEDVVYGPLKQEMQNTKIGANGYVYVFDSKGTVISHPSLAIGSSIADLPFVQQMIQNKANVMTSSDRMPYVYQGKDAVAYYTYFAPMDWVITTRVDPADFSGPVDTLRNAILLILIISIGAGAAIATLFGRSIARRMGDLVTLGRRVMDGDISGASKEIDSNARMVSGGDEIGQVSEAFSGVVNTIQQFSNDITSLSNAAIEGRLDSRGDSGKFKGEYAVMITGLNKTLDSVIGPLKVSAEYMDRISKGDMPKKITDNYNGDFNAIKINLNNCIDNINALTTDANMLADAAVEGKLNTRADTKKHRGDYRKIIEGVNDTIERLVGFIDDMPVPCMIIDKNYQIRFMNKAGTQLGGTTLDGLLKEKTYCYTHFRTGDCKTDRCASCLAMKTGNNAQGATDARPGKNILDISYQSIPLRDKNGDVIGAFELLNDQTEVKTKERQAIEAEKQATNAGKLASKIVAYQTGETDKLTIALDKLAVGDLTIDLTQAKGDEETAQVHATFAQIYKSLGQCTTAINNLIKDTNQLSTAAVQGKLNTRADTSKHQGDYQKIVEGVNQTLDSVIEPVNEALRVSKGYATQDFTTRVDPNLKVPGDWLAFKEALNNIGISVSDAMTNISAQVTDLAAGAEEANASVEEVSAGAGQVAKNTSAVSVNVEKSMGGIEQVQKAMEDLSRTIQEVATRADMTAKLVQDTTLYSKEGMDLARKTENGMQGITKSSNDVNVIILEIKGQMDKISEIVNLITDLANQTNLLALNAAIEAARAGDAGRGFAVVATEVKSLAVESRASAEKISDMINSLQTQTNSAVDAVTAANNGVKQGSEALHDTLSSFSKIVESIDQISKNISDVAAAAEEQAASVEEVTASVNEVGGLMQNTSKESTDAAAASEESAAAIDQITKVIGNVNNIVDKVTKEVSRFKC
ncbi:MAG: Cache 3/Cache 2 fusion domain-containing protein [Methanoregula sp.]|nr:Cache 3/Cache 2 fusion domain-containing protein [Methanoregula sp.]